MTESIPILEVIIPVVAAATGVTSLEMRSHRRAKRLVDARHAAMWLAREFSLHSFPTIGRAFLRDHTAVMYGCSRATERMATDVAFAELMAGLVAVLRAEVGALH